MAWLKRWRRDEPKRCAICGMEQKEDIISLARGSQGQTEIFFSHLPTLFCGQPDHDRRFADPDFGARLIDAVFWRKDIPMAQPGFWTRIKCIHCGKVLNQEAAYPGEVGGTLTIKDVPSFGIRIHGPLVTCPRCGTEQLRATKEVGQHVSGAFVDAFKRIRLKP